MQFLFFVYGEPKCRFLLALYLTNVPHRARILPEVIIYNRKYNFLLYKNCSKMSITRHLAAVFYNSEYLQNINIFSCQRFIHTADCAEFSTHTACIAVVIFRTSAVTDCSCCIRIQCACDTVLPSQAFFSRHPSYHQYLLLL